MEPINTAYKGYLITTDKQKMYPEQIHQWLSGESYWAKDISYSVVKTSFDNSFCIGVLKGEEQIGFGRFVTDYAVMAYLADVYVKEEHRSKGLSKEMMRILMGLDWVEKLRSLWLGTKDAHGLYAQYGFAQPEFPHRVMHIQRPDIYAKVNNAS
jgi:hypothetical protein